ncbi:MAG: DUF362 domain-containing protein, partial [Elusimicrobiota bacterium]
QSIPLNPGPFNKWPGRYILNFNKNSCPFGTVNESVVMDMSDETIRLLTGQNDLGLAWRSLFPVLKSDTKIAVKINILGDGTWTCMELVKGIFEGLKLMPLDGGGTFQGSQLTIYDGNNGQDIIAKGYDQTNFPGANFCHPCPLANNGDGVWGREYSVALRECNYLINVPVLKGHGSEHEYFTIGFKNHYGTYHPEHVGGNSGSSSKAYLRDINCLGPVFQKTALTVISAIQARREEQGPSGGPDTFPVYVSATDPTAGTTDPSTIIMSTDPVTAEFQAIRIAKIQGGTPPNDVTTAIMPNYLKASGGDTSGTLETVYNIGRINPLEMDKGEIINGTITAQPQPVGIKSITSFKERSLGPVIKDIRPNPFRNKCEIHFNPLPLMKGKTASLRIFSSDGRMVRSFISIINGERGIITWDGKDSSGNPLAPGIYILRLESAGISSKRGVILMQ